MHVFLLQLEDKLAATNAENAKLKKELTELKVSEKLIFSAVGDILHVEDIPQKAFQNLQKRVKEEPKSALLFLPWKQ